MNQYAFSGVFFDDTCQIRNLYVQNIINVMIPSVNHVAKFSRRSRYLTLRRLGFLRVVFSNLTPSLYSKRINLTSI